MAAVTQAIGPDIRTQQPQFQRLDAATGAPGELSHVQLLDKIVGSQGQTSADEVKVSAPAGS